MGPGVRFRLLFPKRIGFLGFSGRFGHIRNDGVTCSSHVSGTIFFNNLFAISHSENWRLFIPAITGQARANSARLGEQLFAICDSLVAFS